MTPEEKMQLLQNANRQIKLEYEGSVVNTYSEHFHLKNGETWVYDKIKHKGACVMIPVDSDETIIFVRQYRPAVGKILIELPAGKLDNNEKLLVCAQRELREEIKMKANRLKHIKSTYPAPGYSDEILHFFMATDLTSDPLPHEEKEAIEIIKYPLHIVIEKILNGEIEDDKTITGVFLYEKLCKKNY